MSVSKTDHTASIADVRRYLRQFDTLAGGAISNEQHLAAMQAHMGSLRASLADGLDLPLERFRLARIAAHAIALMTDGDE
jgi:hypothetical protein